MGKVSSVVDTVLGEALAGDYADMVGIVSVIDNRSRATGVSYQDVVAAPGQFDAFGKSLPAGVGQYRDMAKQAIADVKARGPVHAATFYATPAAAKGLPRGLALETKTRGHNYYSDPKGRAIATTQGYKSPDLSKISPASRAVAMTPEVGPVPTAKPDVGPTAVAFAPEPTVAPADDAFSAVMSAPSRGQGLEALANPADLSRVANPSAPGIGVMNFSPPSTAVRSQPVDPALTGIVSKAVSALGPGYGWSTTSGGQPAIGTSTSRVGSTRHDEGKAIDGFVTLDGVALNPVENRQAYMDTLTNLAEFGVGGLGHYGWGIHADIGRANAWGPTTRSASLDPGFGLAIDQGRALSGLGGSYPTPTSREAALGGFTQTAFNETTPDIGMPDMGRSEAEAPSAPGFSQASFNEMTADIGMPGTGSKGFSQTAFNEMTDDIGMPTAGPSFGNVTSTTQAAKEDAILDGLEQAAKQQAAAAPTVAPVTAPNPVAPAAVATPAANVMAAPSGGARSAPTAPAPAATAADVWGGRAAAGRATNGNQVSRNPDGTISMTSSKYGYTDTYAPDGSFRGTTAPGLFGIDQAARSMFGGLGTGKGLAAPGFGKGFSAKGALSGAAKGMAFGVPGMALGAVLGGFATPVAPTPAQAIRSYQQGYQGGLGFPTAPDGPSSQGGLTAYGEAASRGDFGGQAQAAADNPGTGLF
jgi:hypothetical protein